MKIESSLKNTEPTLSVCSVWCCNLHRVGQGDAREHGLKMCLLFSFFSLVVSNAWWFLSRSDQETVLTFRHNLLLLQYSLYMYTPSQGTITQTKS